MALAAVPSSLMLAVTAKLSTDVAPVPLIWVVPLALYLISFMLVFSPGRGGRAAAKIAAACLPVCALTAVWLLATERSTPVAFVFAAYLLLVLCAATACHGRLAATRPAPQHLTLFYLAVGAGGAAGGLFNALLAPVIFDGLAELPLAIIGALLCLPAPAGRHALAASAARVLVLASALALVAGDWPLPALAGDELLFAGLACACVLLSAWPRALALAAAAVLLVGWLPAAFDDSVLLRERSFFGTIQVRAFGENGRGRQLLHGTTRHGAQFDVGARPPEPISYYHRSGPAAMAARVLRRRGALPAAAVVGLGAGAMACHGSRGERWIFFEVDPEIARIAADPELFSYRARLPARAAHPHRRRPAGPRSDGVRLARADRAGRVQLGRGSASPRSRATLWPCTARACCRAASWRSTYPTATWTWKPHWATSHASWGWPVSTRWTPRSTGAGSSSPASSTPSGCSWPTTRARWGGWPTGRGA